MDSTLDKSINLKLDEVKDLLYNLLLTNANEEIEATTTLIKNQLQSLRSELITDTDSTTTTLESRIISKVLEVYNALLLEITAIKQTEALQGNLITSNNTILNSLQSLAGLNTDLQNYYSLLNQNVNDKSTATANTLSTIQSTLNSIQTTMQSGGGGLTQSQEQTLTNTYNNTVQLLNGNSSSGNSDEVLTELNNIKLDLQSVLEKLDLTPNQMQSEPPYNPAPNVVYQTRSTHISEHIYNLNYPINLDYVYFTINDNITAMAKVEFDIQTNADLSELTAHLFLNGETLICEKTQDVQTGTTHFVMYGGFITTRTDNYLMLSFSNLQNINYTVTNVVYEVMGENANFIDYRHKYYLYTCNFDYYLFKVENGVVSYKTTDVFNPDFSGDFTVIVSDNSYTYIPFIVVTAETGNTNAMSAFNCIRVLRQNRTTNEVTCIDETGTQVCTCDIVDTKSYDRYFVFMSNYSSYIAYLVRYDTKTKQAMLKGFSKDNKTFTSFKTLKDYSQQKIMVNGSPVLVMSSYNRGNLPNPYGVITTCDGMNYFEMVSNYKSTCCLGYGTRVRVAEIPNFQGDIQPVRNLLRLRAFLYVYDHWVALYLSRTSYYEVEILKAKTINGDFDEILPGFNGEYFGVKNGQLTRFYDSDVVPVEFAS